MPERPHIPARASAIIDRYCAERGFDRETFLGLKPWPTRYGRPVRGRSTLQRARWDCWRELIEVRREFDGRLLYSKLRVARWFGVDHTTVVYATNPATRLRKAWWRELRELAA